MHILTHHKCASTWLTRYVTEYVNINSLSMSHTHYSAKIPEGRYDCNVITNASYEFISSRVENGIHVIRNPLDIIVSAYFSHKSTHPLDGWPALAMQRKILRSVDQHDGMMLTIAFLERDDFYDGAIGPLHALRHWNFTDDRFVTLRMEDVVVNPSVVGRLLQRRDFEKRLPNDDNHTFEAITGREKGNVDNSSHYRSGLPGDWRVLLPAGAIEYVRGHFERLLKAFYPETLAHTSETEVFEFRDSSSLRSEPSRRAC